MDQLERITIMEQKMRMIKENMDYLYVGLQNYLNLLPQMKELEDYYESQKWMNDHDDDEQGRLPSDLKRGVLSEDGVWNIFEEREECLQMMKQILSDREKE